MNQQREQDKNLNHENPTWIKRQWKCLSAWLQTLSFRTGVIMLVICAVCYAVSFLQMLLPISLAAKGVLWFIFFGLAKTAQYTALLIIGVEGMKRLKQRFRRHDKDNN